MKSRLFILLLISLIFYIGCSDPCDDLLNLDCETADSDMDGILNIDDVAPLDPCIPEESNLVCPTGDVDMDGVTNDNDENPSDPCLPEDNLACPTGDLDNDGIINSEDSDPLARCIPKVPDIELNIIGTWKYILGGLVKFNQDGTYEDLEGELISIGGDNNDIVSQTWSIQHDSILELVITNSFNTPYTHNMEVLNNKCDQLNINLIVGAGTVVIFNRQ